MDYRRATRIFEGALVALVIALQAGLFLWPESSGRPNLVLATGHDAQLLSAIVLALAWTVLGPGLAWIRWAVLPVLAVAWLLPWNTRMLPRETTSGFQITVAAVAAGTALVLWLCGQRVRCLGTGGRERGAQFSLLGLILATTLVAAAIGSLEALRPILRSQSASELALLFSRLGGENEAAADAWLSPRLVRQTVMAAAVAFAALGGLWITLRPGAIWWRLGAVALAIPVLAVYLTNLSVSGSGRFPGLSGVADTWNLATAVDLALAWTAVAFLAGMTVLPLRLFDYRLQRPAKAACRAQAADAVTPATSHRSPALLIGAVVLLAIVIGGMGLASRGNPQLRPPQAAIASWIEPNPWSTELSLIIDGRYYIHLQPEDGIGETAVREAMNLAPHRTGIQPQEEWAIEPGNGENPTFAPSAGEEP